MAITYPLTMPSVGGISALYWSLDNTVSETASDYSGARNFYDRDWMRWKAQVTLAAMNESDSRQWAGFFDSLKGGEGVFYLGPTLDGLPTGDLADDYGKVGGVSPNYYDAGAAASGVKVDTITTRNWSASGQTIPRGTWFQIGDGLHVTVEDEPIIALGEANPVFVPPLRQSHADGTLIETENPKGLFELDEENPVEFVFDKNGVCLPVTFTAIEAVKYFAD